MAKRNWRKWWYGYLTHWAEGVAVGYMAFHHPIPALIVSGFLLSYQWAGWVKYHDTVKLDIFDLGVGVAAGVVLALVLPLVW